MTREQNQMVWDGSHRHYNSSEEHDVRSSSSRSQEYSSIQQDFMVNTSKDSGHTSASFPQGSEGMKSNHADSSGCNSKGSTSPPTFSNWLIEQSITESKSGINSRFIPPPPIPPSFKREIIASSSSLTFQPSALLFQPPLPQISVPPPPPPLIINENDAAGRSEIVNIIDTRNLSDTVASENTHSTIQAFIPTEECISATIAIAAAGPGQWMLVEDEAPVVEVIEVGVWERHTKGIGGKLLERMGYIRGLGLGKTAQGRLNPVEATTSRGLGQKDDNYDTSERKGAEADTLSGCQSAAVIASDTKWPYADPLYTNIKTKPQGSGGFKKRKAGSDNKNSNSNNNGMETNNKKGTVFDFLNKIPSSTAVSGNASLRKSGGVVKSSTSSSLAPKKDLKKMTAKSAF